MITIVLLVVVLLLFPTAKIRKFYESAQKL